MHINSMKNPEISKCLNNEINEVFRTKDEKEDQRLNMQFASPWPEKYQIHPASFLVVSPPVNRNRIEIMKFAQSSLTYTFASLVAG